MSRHCAAAKILLTVCIYILANEMDINDSGCRGREHFLWLDWVPDPGSQAAERALMHIHVFAEQMYKYTLLRVSSNFKTTSYKYQFKMINWNVLQTSLRNTMASEKFPTRSSSFILLLIEIDELNLFPPTLLSSQ